MKQLEMVYLMKVALHLETMGDIKEFEQINKKCSTSLITLKINPWFESPKDIEQFVGLFKPTTCNCNQEIIRNEVLLKVEKIRNFKLKLLEPGFQLEESEKNVLTQIIPKIESLISFNFFKNEQIEIIVKNISPKLKIRCDQEFFVRFEQEFEKQEVPMSYYPKQIIFDMKENFKNCDEIKNIEQKNIIAICRDRMSEKHYEGLLKNKISTVYVSNIDGNIYDKTQNFQFSRGNFISKRSCHHRYYPFENTVYLEDLFDEVKKNKIFEILSKLNANGIQIINEGPTEDKDISNLPKIKFPYFIKKIKYEQYDEGSTFILPFELDGIEEYEGTLFFEVNEKNNLKKLKLERATEITYPKSSFNGHDGLSKWGKEEIPNAFEKLEELELAYCTGIQFDYQLKNLKFLELYNFNDSFINASSEYLSDIELSSAKNSKIILQANSDKLIELIYLEGCKITIQCKSGIKPNIELISCFHTKIKCKSMFGSVILNGSKDISFNDGFRCELLDLNQSSITEGNIKSSTVKLTSIDKYCSIDLNESKEIYFVEVKKFIFQNIFGKCKKLMVDGCEKCSFELGTNGIEEMKVNDCEQVVMKGNLSNIKTYIANGNMDCSLPNINNTNDKDEEIFELTKDIDIKCDSKSIIIRNGKNVKCKIELTIKSDVTFENCDNVDIYLKARHIGDLSFIN